MGSDRLFLKPDLPPLNPLRNAILADEIHAAVVLEGDHKALRLAGNFLFERRLSVAFSSSAHEVTHAGG